MKRLIVRQSWGQVFQKKGINLAPYKGVKVSVVPRGWWLFFGAEEKENSNPTDQMEFLVVMTFNQMLFQVKIEDLGSFWRHDSEHPEYGV